ncbi:hypothetical protein [Sphingomonas sp.]|uniref:hypothetical protein n=1 Tax=Sphingomonas sp. TaxID=28214 RepID=UPI0035BC3DF9
MSIIGIGAMYGGTQDVSADFVERGVAAIGFEPVNAPFTHSQMATLKVGDMIFIKSYPPHLGLYIKAVGVVIDAVIKPIEGLGYGVDVRWAWHDINNPVVLGKMDDRGDHVRRGTFYEEVGPAVQAVVIDLLLGS